MDKKYAKAYTEVLEILKHIPKEEYERIPKTEIQFYESNCDKTYKYEYDETKEVKDQVISREANAVIISIYMNYFANEKQKSIIDEILKQNAINEENEKKEKYNINNIFNKPQENPNQNETLENLPVKIDEKKDNFIKRIINKIKKMLVKA